MAAPSGENPEVFCSRAGEVNRIVHDLVTAMGGSICAEHGVGMLRREELARCKPAIDIELMRTLKRSFDPHVRLNPGKILAEADRR